MNRHTLIVDNSGVIDLQRVPLMGSHNVKFVASKYLVLDYVLRIWEDNTKANEMTPTEGLETVKDGVNLMMVINAVAYGLELQEYYYEIIEISPTNAKRVICGKMQMIR